MGLSGRKAGRTQTMQSTEPGRRSGGSLEVHSLRWGSPHLRWCEVRVTAVGHLVGVHRKGWEKISNSP